MHLTDLIENQRQFIKKTLDLDERKREHSFHLI
jgi:hypothetical protein